MAHENEVAFRRDSMKGIFGGLKERLLYILEVNFYLLHVRLKELKRKWKLNTTKLENIALQLLENT